MRSLQEKIINEGQVISDTILKVDSFLNHQIDPEFVMAMGRELANRYAGEEVTKVLTVEASGIALALTTGLALKTPVVFAKKKKAATQDSQTYSTKIFSFTRQEAVDIYVNKKLIHARDRVLIIDDFLAHGEALRGLADIVEQAGATLVGVGIAIEKVFQNGGQALRKKGIRIESLAPITSLSGGRVSFV